MSLLVQAMTSDDDDEIEDALAAVKRVSHLGLIHESVHVERGRDYTRECLELQLLAILLTSF
jgi:meiotically up-regulated gene 157 (Mug157) protein